MHGRTERLTLLASLRAVASLASIGIVPLVVTQVSCASFDFTTEDPTQAAYWMERWCVMCASCWGTTLFWNASDVCARPLGGLRRFAHIA
jgi:hypothetical protein